MSGVDRSGPRGQVPVDHDTHGAEESQLPAEVLADESVPRASDRYDAGGPVTLGDDPSGRFNLEQPGRGQPAPVAGPVARAMALRDEGKGSEADTLLRRTLNDRTKPRRVRAEAAVALAVASLEGRGTHEAEIFMLRARALDQAVPGAKRVELDILVERGESGRALAVVDELLAVTPDDPALGIIRGKLLRDLNRPADATAQAERALRAAEELAGAAINPAAEKIDAEPSSWFDKLLDWLLTIISLGAIATRTVSGKINTTQWQNAGRSLAVRGGSNLHRAAVALGPAAVRERLTRAVERENPDITAAEARNMGAALAEGMLAAYGDDPISIEGPERLLIKARLLRGRMAYETGDVAGAVEMYRTILARDPTHYSAHWRISEIVLPDFDAPYRPQIERMFDQANAAYRRGTLEDYREMARLALEILELDPNDGLAHRLYAVSRDYIRRAERSMPLLSVIDTPAERTALIAHFSAQMRHSGGQVSDFFPDWDRLDDTQRAMVAYSALPYARFFGDILAAGGTYRLSEPATSNADTDPDRTPQSRLGGKRYFYTVRGWQHHDFVATGLERLDTAAHGGYNTVTHEIAHLVHRIMRQARRHRVEQGESSLSPRERQLAGWADRITRLFDEARHGRDGQRLLDVYSGTNEREYFAQGMMAYINPLDRSEERSRRLFARNENMWHFVRDVIQSNRDYPEAAPAVDHPPRGAGGSPLMVHRMLQNPLTDAQRSRAEAILAEWEDLYNPSEGDPAEGAERQRRYEDLVERAAVLRREVGD